MAGSGTYINFTDRERVGVYTKFVAKKSTDFESPDTTGIVAIGLPMDYGEDGKAIEVLATELEDGSCVSKIGYTLSDEEILPYRLALVGAYKAYFFKLNKGGEKAKATIGDITYTAKYSGTLGNNIKVVIKADTPKAGTYCVMTYFKDAKKETFYVSSGEALLAKESAWVDFSATSTTPTITANDGTLLTGGTNGAIDADTSYDDFFKAIKYKMYNYIACYGADTTISDKIVEFVNKQITNKGKFVGGVVYDKPLLNDRNIISVDQGLECDDFTISLELMPIFVASLRAGCSLGACLDNNDMTTLVGAHTIINPVNDDDDTEIIEALKQGKFLFSYWNDGTVVVEEDINTYTEYSDEAPADYRRNRLIATMNYIANEAQIRLNKNVVDGKHADDDDGNTRYIVKTIVDNICTDLFNSATIGSYNPSTDIVVSGITGRTDALTYTTYLKYKDSIRQIFGEYTIVLN
jgi:hypothetical protein